MRHEQRPRGKTPGRRNIRTIRNQWRSRKVWEGANGAIAPPPDVKIRMRNVLLKRRLLRFIGERNGTFTIDNFYFYRNVLNCVDLPP